MYLKQVIIDGFKTYGTKVYINDLDNAFNAVIGPNGSGKSAMLDAILFVLGIQKMEQVRCKSLVELINNSGGCNKASVTLVFDNSDPAKSPHGFETREQITVERSVRCTFRGSHSDSPACTVGARPRSSPTTRRPLPNRPQISKSGRSGGYRINGAKAEVNRVHNLFQSVQLNVNNPTFLVRAAPLVQLSCARVAGDEHQSTEGTAPTNL